MVFTKEPNDLTPEDALAALAQDSQVLKVRGGILAPEKAGLAIKRAGEGP